MKLPKEIKLYLDFIESNLCKIPADKLEEFGKKLNIKTLDKKELFSSSGMIQTDIGFIINGLIRSYYIDDKGKDITVKFYTENSFVTHYSAFLNNTPSSYSFVCLEPVTLVTISSEAINFAYDISKDFEKFGRLVAENVLKIQESRIESFLFKNAEQRYNDFLIDYPNLFSRISLTHLCSYLGVERQTLTRLRQKIANK
ncbi:MAG: Crp/Fnr family transcriptional regulator [Chitinophagaceae bacterium]|jgi:CRP/FNR family transcriptional regulator|nr:Crp/Fnr family transcriptional regulator [Chitinophagaceae bacterium]